MTIPLVLLCVLVVVFLATRVRRHQRVIPTAIGMMPELREKNRPQKNGVKKFTEWSVKPKTLGGFYNS